MAALTKLGEQVLSLGRELFGFAIRGNPKVAEIAKVNGVTMDTLESASDETLNAILDRAYKSEAMDKRFAQNISKQIKKDSLGALSGVNEYWEGLMNPPTLKVDNPGGDWLERKLKKAEKERNEAPPNTFQANFGTGEGNTAWLDKSIMLDPQMLAGIKGAAFEELYRPDPGKISDLKKSIKEKGYLSSPVKIYVREDGVPFVMEGNHRIIEALESGREKIPVEIDYFRGAEDIEDGMFSPSNLGVLR
jgi:hypothetical protein|tara:strand:+ start:7187 stop:7930 length:744 start_codon:yes stop_codon:yes gene_type:complete